MSFYCRDRALDARLGWIAFQLRSSHGIERSRDEVWWSVYNDAGRDVGLANEMVESIADDREALARFADSLDAGRRRVVVVGAERSGWFDVWWCLVAIGAFFVGVGMGVMR